MSDLNPSTSIVAPPSESTKTCSKCGQRKSAASFSNKRGTKDGLQYECKACVADYCQERKKRNNPNYGAMERERAKAEARLAKGEKECSSCHEVLPVDRFSMDGGRRDGLYPYCKACKSSGQKRSRRRNDPRVALNDRQRAAREELRTLGLKRCSKCKRTLDLMSFSPSSSGSLDGRRSRCKSCSSEDVRHKYLQQPGRGDYLARKNNEDELRSRGVQLCLACDCVKPREEFNKNAWRRLATERVCKACQSQRQRDYYEANPEIVRESNRRYREQNRRKLNEQRKRRYATDPQFRMTVTIRNRVNGALRKSQAAKTSSAVKALGCSMTIFRQHIEAQFADAPPNRITGERMSWSNHGRGGWELDHIKPLSKFKFDDPDELARACHYTNYQPLWWYENLEKSDKWDGE